MFCAFSVALELEKTEETCSSITISWTLEANRTANFLIIFRSSVHGGHVKYRRDASPPYSTKLTNLVADTVYTIEVTATYSDNTIKMDHVTTKTKLGAPSTKGMYTCKSLRN